MAEKSMAFCRQQRLSLGITLIELLVVIGIIAILMSLLIPAVMYARSTARRVQCLSRIREVGQAVEMHTGRNRGFYPGLNEPRLTYKNPALFEFPKDVSGAFQGQSSIGWGSGAHANWVMSIFPELDQNEVVEDLQDDTRRGLHVVGRGQSDFHIPVLVCPSDSHPEFTSDGPAIAMLSFVANTGIYDVNPDSVPARQRRDHLPDSQANGVFNRRDVGIGFRRANSGAMRVDRGYVSRHDGLRQTLMLAENVDAGLWYSKTELNIGFTWWDSWEQKPVFRINERVDERPSNRSGTHPWGLSDKRFARPSSNHGDGVNVYFCDGHSQFLREDIEYRVYVQLMTPNGKKAMINVDKGILAPAEYRQPLGSNDF